MLILHYDNYNSNYKRAFFNNKAKVVKIMNTQTKKATLKKTVDVRATLLAISLGSSVIIKTRDISANRIRAAVSRLNNEAYLFETSEKGLVDEVKVTRLK